MSLGRRIFILVFGLELFSTSALWSAEVVRVGYPSLATGFAEQSHFSRVFKDVVGVSPGAWQRDHRR